MSNIIDLTGRRFGRLAVLRRAENRGGRVCWLCLCVCGNEKIVSGHDLNGGCTRSCGCLRRGSYGNRVKDITGKRYGRLLAVRQLETKKHGTYEWLCHCDCGNEKIVSRHSLNGGDTKSCGCFFNHHKDLPGRKCGLLTIKKPILSPVSSGSVLWLCRCDCGKEKRVRRDYLTTAWKHGTVVSCGCFSQNFNALLGTAVFREYGKERIREILIGPSTKEKRKCLDLARKRRRLLELRRMAQCASRRLRKRGV